VYSADSGAVHIPGIPARLRSCGRACVAELSPRHACFPLPPRYSTHLAHLINRPLLLPAIIAVTASQTQPHSPPTQPIPYFRPSNQHAWYAERAEEELRTLALSADLLTDTSYLSLSVCVVCLRSHQPHCHCRGARAPQEDLPDLVHWRGYQGPRQVGHHRCRPAHWRSLPVYVRQPQHAHAPLRPRYSRSLSLARTGPRFRAVNYRIKVFAFGGFCSAGFAIAAEKAGILCARYPPWVLNSGSLPAPAAAEKPAA